MKFFRRILSLTMGSLLAMGFVVIEPTSIPMEASAETIISQLGIDIDGEAAGDDFGNAISLSSDGTRVAIGAPFNDGNGSDSGHVRIYDWDGFAWVQVGLDIDGEAAGDYFGSRAVSLSSDGTRVAIGATTNDGNGSDSGHVRIYHWDGSAWVQVGSDIDGEAAGDVSGFAISLSSNGTTVAIGAPYNGGNGSQSGHVRIYTWVFSAWVQVGLDIDGETAGDRSGYSVSLSSDGTRVAVGAPLNGGNGSQSGHVRIYGWDGSAWVQVGSDIEGETAGDLLGVVSLSSDGTRVASGAPYNDGNGSDSGHVRIFDWDGSVWVQVGSDIDGEAAGDLSGWSLSLSGNGTRVAIGAQVNGGNGSNSGHVRIYDWNGSAWVQVGGDIDGEAGGDISGYAVHLSSDGTRVAIGAPYNDGNGNESGHARLFSLEDLQAALTPTFASPTQTGDGFTVQVSNYDANFTWNVSADLGSVAISSSGRITVTGLSTGASASVTVGTSRSGYTAGSATVSGSALEATPEAPAAPAPIPAYSGPTLDSKQSVVAGEQVSFSGRRLHYVSSAYAGTTKLTIVSGVSELLVLDVPASVVAGSYDLVLYSSHGKLTFQQGLTVKAPAPEVTQPEVIEPEAVKKLTVGSFKGFIAIYSQGYEGAKLSAKVAGKWLVVDALDESFKGNDYSRTVRFTGAGYDILVHLYINGELIKTEELITQ